jgi:hypothetical protein
MSFPEKHLRKNFFFLPFGRVLKWIYCSQIKNELFEPKIPGRPITAAQLHRARLQ